MDYLKYLQAANVPAHLHPQAIEDLQAAAARARKLTPYKLLAPLVMAFVVPRLPWAAERLPARWARFDNDVSILVVERRGRFIVRRNLGWKINNVLNAGHGIANVVHIPWSLLAWKGD